MAQDPENGLPFWMSKKIGPPECWTCTSAPWLKVRAVSHRKPHCLGYRWVQELRRPIETVRQREGTELNDTGRAITRGSIYLRFYSNSASSTMKQNTEFDIQRLASDRAMNEVNS